MADNVEMQGLEFQIVNDSTQAVAGLQNLINTLNRLKTATNGGATGLSKTAQGIRELSNSLKGLNSGDASQKITRLATALTALSQVGNVKISSSIANQLTAINTALGNLKWTDGDKLTALANGLRPLSEVGKANMTTFIHQLEKLPSVIEELDKADLDKFINQMNQLAAAMKPFADEMLKVSNGFSAFPSKIQRLVTSTNIYNKAVSGATTRTDAWATALKGIKLSTVWYATKRLGSALADYMYDASEWEGIMYRFGRAMGEFAQENYEWITRLNSEMKVNIQQFMQYSSIFGTMLKGYGVATEDAAKMAMNYTELTYDIWAGYNDIYKSFEDAAIAVRSAIAGEVEPIRKAGFTIVDSQLKITAANYGIAYSSQKASEELKSYLRYLTLVDQAKAQDLIGTYAKEMTTAEGLMRTLRQQITSLSQAFGSLLLPALVKVLPYVQAFVELIGEAISAFAALFGIELQPVDFSSGLNAGAGAAEDMADNLSDATSAAKKLKQYTLGFDELNVIDPNKGSGSSAGAAGGSYAGMFDIDKLWDESIFKNINDQVDELKEKLKPVLDLVVAIGATILAWKFSTKFINGLSTLKELGRSGFSIPLTITAGLILAGTGFTIEFSGIKDAIKKGLNGFNFSEIILGGLTGVGGFALLGKGIGKFIAKAFSSSAVAQAITAGGGTISTGLIGAAIGGIVAGIPMFVTGVYDAIMNGLNWLNGLLIPAGSTLAGAGVGAIIGSLGGPIGTGVGALIGLVIGGLTDIGLAVSEHWDEIKTFFTPAAEWFNTTVIQPVATFFSNLWSDISTWASESWTKIKEFFAPAVAWFSDLFGSVRQTVEDVFYNIGVIASGCWETVKIVWGIASCWMDENVIQPISVFFSKLWDDVSSWAISAWEDIKSVFITISDWMDENVIQPIADAVSKLRDAIEVCFSGVVDFFKGILNGIIDALNSALSWIFDGINDVLSDLSDITIAGQSPFEGIREINVPQIPLLADGGFVNQGQLFIAREAGAEMVGAMGRRTAVANNDQIVEGISAGVSDANEEVVNALFAIGSMIVKSIEDKDTSVSLDYRNLSRNLHPYLKQESVIRGKSLVNA